ncbi:YDG/SRA domain-containing protein [Streptosporangium sp. NPDC050855]|uniref:caspase, EACC1-associated type n=1 Tax=Streptosporangium sp. NPDC050855 TaxID=3366194 RepID=UPI0037884DBD
MKLPDPRLSRAVLIGTSKYESENLPDLPTVANNLAAIKEALCDHSIWGLPPQHCRVIREPAQSPQMIDPVIKASEEATDTLIVYFAGHGLADPDLGELYLALTGSDDDPRRVSFTAVAYDHIRRAIVHGGAKRKIVILDCCYSGRAIRAMSSTDNISTQANIEGTCVITSAAKDKLALAPPGELYTTFTAELVNVLQHGIEGQPKRLTINNIYNHIHLALKSKTAPLPQIQNRNTAGQLELINNRAVISQNETPPGYGPVPGVEVGTEFPDRKALHKANVHRPLQAGICGTQRNGGAESIVVSGGYKDDRDYGDVIIYTGHGGRDPNTGHQIADQHESDPGNSALIASQMSRLPVRVIRGAEAGTEHSPSQGYSYDGLFVVADHWSTIGEDKFRILQFRLEKLNEDSDGNLLDEDEAAGSRNIRAHIAPNRWEQVSRGIYQDRKLVEHVKKAHDHECQVCGIALETIGGLRYAETSHIRGLGIPHNGPDTRDNILCLCPNHRMLFEFGAIVVDEKLQVVDQITGEIIDDLRMNSKHRVSQEHLRYHRELHQTANSGP